MKFETVVNFLRKKLDCKPTDSVFLYVNSVFAPGGFRVQGKTVSAAEKVLADARAVQDAGAFAMVLEWFGL